MNAEYFINNPAFGHPGIEPRWTQSTKSGVGTAYSSSSRLWFTLSHGIVNEIYYPTTDTPNTRDLQFLVTDGKTFFHEERRDFNVELEYPDRNALLYRLTNTEKGGRYRIVKEVFSDPHAPVLLMHCRLEVLDSGLSGKLQLFVLLAPHIGGYGARNSASVIDRGGRALLHACRKDLHLAMGASSDFKQRSVGYVGYSDGWQDLNNNFKMDWNFDSAENGNVSLMAEVDYTEGKDFTIAVGMGQSLASAVAFLCQSLAIPIALQRKDFIKQWQRARVVAMGAEVNALTPDDGQLFRHSRCVLLAHEDKIFSGAMIASMSIPWGETKSDADLGGYHLVWARDMMNSAMGLLASGQVETPLRALVWLSCVQRSDGSMPQNSWITGDDYWSGLQLDEVAAPVLLAWALHTHGALKEFYPWSMVVRAVRYLILNGPVTDQERWEENSGYSPSTLATVISAMVCAAEFASLRGEDNAAELYLSYADWLSAHLEEWTTTRTGELLEGVAKHYIRINPASRDKLGEFTSPDESYIDIKNDGGRHPAKNIVDGGFLELVRYGVRDAHDPLIENTVKVIDAVLKVDLPEGPGWLRYNNDGYGQKIDGSAFEHSGRGGAWPLLSGERGHYEIAAGRDAMPYIQYLNNVANEGDMLPEQVWAEPFDLPDLNLFRGKPTGSAMPLCWAHAEYISLVRSQLLGRPFARIDPVYKRYAEDKTSSSMEIWTLSHRITSIPKEKALRIILEDFQKVIWWMDENPQSIKVEAADNLNGLFIVDINSEQKPFSFRISSQPQNSFKIGIY